MAQAATYREAAHMHAAMNELASLRLYRQYRWALLVMTILTVLVGFQGVSTVVFASGAWQDIALGVCQILLAITVSVLSNFELKGRAQTYAKRATAYTRLATDIRRQMMASQRMRAEKFLEFVTAQAAALDEMADPLPIDIRRQATAATNHDLLSMWSGQPASPYAAAPVRVRGPASTGARTQASSRFERMLSAFRATAWQARRGAPAGDPVTDPVTDSASAEAAAPATVVAETPMDVEHGAGSMGSGVWGGSEPEARPEVRVGAGAGAGAGVVPNDVSLIIRQGLETCAHCQ
jgi:hypothetical protein